MKSQHQDTLALVAHKVPVEMHAHNAVQLVVSLDYPYPSVLDGTRHEFIRGFLIDANVPHACQCTASTVLVISIDANAAKGKNLKRSLEGRRFRLLEELIARETLQDFRVAYWQHQTLDVSPFDPLALILEICATSPPLSAPDPRMQCAMDFVAQNIGRTLRLSDIAAETTLSEGRLRHLFVRDVGISWTTYVLWSRMKVALNSLVAQGMTLAEAAHHAGYADQAHFTRMFRRMFGISPSLLLKHSQFLKVFETS